MATESAHYGHGVSNNISRPFIIKLIFLLEKDLESRSEGKISSGNGSLMGNATCSSRPQWIRDFAVWNFYGSHILEGGGWSKISPSQVALGGGDVVFCGRMESTT